MVLPVLWRRVCSTVVSSQRSMDALGLTGAHRATLTVSASGPNSSVAL